MNVYYHHILLFYLKYVEGVKWQVRLADEKLLCCYCVTKVPVDKSKIVFEYQVVFDHQMRPQKPAYTTEKSWCFKGACF